MLMLNATSSRWRRCTAFFGSIQKPLPMAWRWLMLAVFRWMSAILLTRRGWPARGEARWKNWNTPPGGGEGIVPGIPGPKDARHPDNGAGIHRSEELCVVFPYRL